MANTNQQLSDQLEVLTKDLGRLRDDLKKAFDTLLSTGLEQSDESKERIVKIGKKTMKRTANTIQDRPFLSVLITLVLGLVLGMLLDHKLRS